MLINELLGSLAWYGQSSLFGLEGDKLAHLALGYVCFILVLRSKFGLGTALFFVFGIGMGKELLDSQVLTHTLEASIADFGYTMLLPVAHFLVVFWGELSSMCKTSRRNFKRSYHYRYSKINRHMGHLKRQPQVLFYGSKRDMHI